MKKYYLSFIISILLSIYPVSAQLSLQFNTINEYIFSTREAMSLTAVNAGTIPFEVEFRGRIKDASGDNVVEFTSHPFLINPGLNLVSPYNPGIKDITFFSSDIAEIELRTGSYPSGNYFICIWTACTKPDCNGAGQYAGSVETPVCINVRVENPTPLLLTYPENESVIIETRPIYTWIPPAPVAASSLLNYTMKLVEVFEGQGKADALSLNRPLIEQEGISNPTLMHSLDLPSLEAGKTYAWQVEAYVGGTFIARSEQWKFKVKEDTIDLQKVPRELSYIEIAGQTGTSIFYAVGVLKLRHVVRFESGQIIMKVKDKNSKEVMLLHSQFKIEPGDNRLVLDLEGSLNYKHGETYTLSGVLLGGEPFTIKFIYINPRLLKDE